MFTIYIPIPLIYPFHPPFHTRMALSELFHPPITWLPYSDTLKIQLWGLRIVAVSQVDPGWLPKTVSIFETYWETD